MLSLLRSADVTDGGRLPDQVGWLAARRVVQFVACDEYLSFADRVEQENAETRYDIWVVWDAAAFGKAVVRVKQLLGVGLREAREQVQLERAVGTGLRAHEVVDWARRFREVGLGVRVEPEFRWRLP